jgi:two-component system, sensor histidine kinase LadS
MLIDRRGLLVGLMTGLMSPLLFSGCRSAATAPLQGSASSLVLVEGQEGYALGPHLEILNDPTRRLSIEEVSSQQLSQQFLPSRASVPNYGFTNSAVWVRFRVLNTVSALTDWQLQLHFPRIHEVTLYQPSPDASGAQSFIVKQAGSFLPMSQREVHHRLPTFNLLLPVNREQTFYLRFASRTMMRLPLMLWSPKALTDHSQAENLGWGLFFGLMLMMFSYNIILSHARAELFIVLRYGGCLCLLPGCLGRMGI